MLDYSLAHRAAFFTAAVSLSLFPGPDMAFIWLGIQALRSKGPIVSANGQVSPKDFRKWKSIYSSIGHRRLVFDPRT